MTTSCIDEAVHWQRITVRVNLLSYWLTVRVQPSPLLATLLSSSVQRPVQPCLNCMRCVYNSSRAPRSSRRAQIPIFSCCCATIVSAGLGRTLDHVQVLSRQPNARVQSQSRPAGSAQPSILRTTRLCCYWPAQRLQQLRRPGSGAVNRMQARRWGSAIADRM
jgi:hypothetical protein